MAKPLPLPPPLLCWFVVAGGGEPFAPPLDAGGVLSGLDALADAVVGAGFDVEDGVLDKGFAVSLVESFGMLDVLSLGVVEAVLLSVLVELAVGELVLLALLPRRLERLFLALF
ncbi:MAG TPA: hypothetical protein VLO13_11000 [Halomonas sp.]|nr:hypothetical protein [Halomonas sp.]